MNLTLIHAPQPWPWGCQNYALYSLIGDERIIADVSECSGGRFKLAMLELGYYLQPLWQDITDKNPAPETWWRELFGQYKQDDDGCVTPLLVDIPSLRYSGGDIQVMHSVSVAVRHIGGYNSFQVFDPGASAEQRFDTLDDFLASPYGTAYTVLQVLDKRPEAFPSYYGPDQPHVRPETRMRWIEHIQQQISQCQTVLIHQPNPVSDEKEPETPEPGPCPKACQACAQSKATAPA